MARPSTSSMMVSSEAITFCTRWMDWFKANYPKTTIVFKRKGGGGFDAEDPALWAEMKEKADGIIIGLGH